MSRNRRFSKARINNFINKYYILISIVLILLGLLRLLIIGSSGIVDMEFWRAWMSKLDRGNLLTIYSNHPHGLDFFHNLKNKIPVDYPFFRFKDIDPNFFKANWYSQTYYPIVQPPNFYIDLILVNYFNSNFIRNDYIALNFVNVIWTILLNSLVYLLFIKLKINNPFLKSLILVWVNPIILMNTVIQGYRDIYSILFVVGSLLLICYKKYFFAGIIIVLGLLVKPQILFLAIIVIVLIPKKKILNYIFGGIFAIFLVIYVYYITGYLYGLIASFLMVSGATTKWFPSTLSFFTPFTFMQHHQDFIYFNINTNLVSWVNKLTEYLQFISLIHIMGSILAVVLFSKLFVDKIGILFTIEFFYLTVFIFMLRPNGQPNHYFAMSIFWLISLAKFDKFYWSKIIILASFLIQDLGYNGFGRNSFYLGTTSYYSDLIFFLSAVISIVILKDIYRYRNEVLKPNSELSNTRQRNFAEWGKNKL